MWLLILICAAPISTARAQVIISLLFGDALNSEELMFGLHLNYTQSRLTNLEGAENLGGVKAALWFNYKLNDRISFTSELVPPFFFGAKGLPPYPLEDPTLDAQFAAGSVERKIQLTGMTALAQYRVWDYIRIEAGPELYLRTKAIDVFKAESPSGDLELERDIKDQTATFESGVALGATYQLGKGTGMFLGFRYYWGLTDVLTEDTGNQQFRMWQITSGIPVGRKKKLAKNADAANPD
ncbi:MAG: hypothetical protein SFV52_02655 [Saprospiraceae bacterium]|nr:hypothetical protein [Saprospiraceae bacterium]